MATYQKNSAGNHKATIRKRGWPTTSKTFRRKRDAEDWARRTEDEMARGVYVLRSQSERLTLRAALIRYLAEVTPLKKPSTQPSNHTAARQLTADLGGYSLAALTASVIADWRDQRLKQVKPDSVRIELALLSHLYTIAIQEWRVALPANPVSLIRKPRPGAARTRRVSDEELARLIAALSAHSNPMLVWIVQLAIHTAMRKGEIVGLRRQDVTMRERTIRLYDTKNGDSRTVPLSRDATEVMAAALANPVRPIDCDLVFFGEPGRDGKRRPYEFSKLFRDAVVAAGIADLRFHDLRHEAVSRFVESGLSDQQVMSISGHKSAQMLKRYTHLRSQNLVDELDRRFGLDQKIHSCHTDLL